VRHGARSEQSARLEPSECGEHQRREEQEEEEEEEEDHDVRDDDDDEHDDCGDGHDVVGDEEVHLQELRQHPVSDGELQAHVGRSGWTFHPRPKMLRCSTTDRTHLVYGRSESADQPEEAIRTA